ncbi:glycosyltransferase involved in cell wall biosynthesis [Flavobacterium nitrogenifigens]|uniref:Glycosyltransferase involved in cell wall biosynthesis n=2 Tax=Flavobacterium TaxID=237 RepID=A0A7W7J0I6_9FLAO|nr:MULTISPECIES: glycosyltransferase family 2 protein [Flavobacterium]MBB4803653.1 glycosyltransferase involved in cell wall biosynthesis [Flavobacterium nitrogenifigens]MBB6388542.1 glycosyltransferase involved in cell wall biosynthesis [Flavobacterium notoginsengisoli]
MNCKISVITINFNNASGLQKTIESVINQSYTDFEYIVIDGGSGDGSKEVIEDYRNHFTYTVSEKDNGIYNAMNKGIKVAKGDFVIFMNSGDLFYNENILENIAKTISVDDEIIYGDVLLRNEDTNMERVQIHPEKLNFSYFYKQTICQQSCIIKRSLFDAIFLYNEDFKIASDWEFFIYAIYIHKVKIKKIDLIVAIYDTRGVSGSSNYKQIFKKEREDTLNKYFPFFVEDYKQLLAYSSNRSQELLQIEKSVFWRKVVSIIFRIILVFIPKKK